MKVIIPILKINPFILSLDDEYIYIQQMNSQWPKLFETYFLSPTTRFCQTTSNDDDLIFYVTRQVQNDFHHPLVNSISIDGKETIAFCFAVFQHLVEVYRHHDVKRQPPLVCARLFSLIIDLKKTPFRQHRNTIGKRLQISISFFINLNTQSRLLYVQKRVINICRFSNDYPRLVSEYDLLKNELNLFAFVESLCESFASRYGKQRNGGENYLSKYLFYC